MGRVGDFRRGSLNEVHGDLWYGNTMWTDGQLTGILDWDCAGTGSPGADLATLRIDAAFCYGGGPAASLQQS